MLRLLNLSWLTLLMFVTGCSTTKQLSAQSAADHAAVIQVVSDLFEAMKQQDGEVIRSLHLPEVALIRVVDNAKPTVRLGSPDGFINSIINAPAEPRERMFNAEVRVDGDLATLWAPYDFHLGDDFSHCGVNALQLVRTDSQWKIVSIAYTVHREGCDHAPPP